MGYGDSVGGRDLKDVPENDSGFEPLPKGWYDVLIIGAEDKETKARNGGYLNFKMEVEGPTHAGRIVFALHLYQHESDVAEKLGLGKLHALARAMGRNSLPRDVMSYSGNRVQVQLKIKPAKDGFEAGNEVVDYKARESGRKGPPSSGGVPPSNVPHGGSFPAGPSPFDDDDIPL